MKPSLVDQEWEVVASLLPDGWRDLARTHGAIRRRRVVGDADMLLRLILMHVASGLSLKQTVMRAGIQGMCRISTVGLHQRLRTSGPWLAELARQMFESSRFGRVRATPPHGRRLRAVDATTVSEPGATGTSWRVHLSIALPEICCDFYELTDVRGGETLKRIPIDFGDIILADRGYSTRQGVAYVVDRGGDVIVRLCTSAVPLLASSGTETFPLLAHLRTLQGTRPGEWNVRFLHGDNYYSARICALRKVKHAAEQAKQAILRRASRSQKKVNPDTLEYAEYVIVLTTMQTRVLSTDSVLELYRVRWQIELCFKRFKSLLKLGHLPKHSDKSAKAWIQAKLLTVLLIEALLSRARLFSPWGYDCAETKSMARVSRGS